MPGYPHHVTQTEVGLPLIDSHNDRNASREKVVTSFAPFAPKFQRAPMMTLHRQLIALPKSRKETSDVPAYQWVYRMRRMSE